MDRPLTLNMFPPANSADERGQSPTDGPSAVRLGTKDQSSLTSFDFFILGPGSVCKINLMKHRAGLGWTIS